MTKIKPQQSQFAPATANRCCFCESENIVRIYSGLFHKVKKDHGPFDLYLCANCKSCLTLPIPPLQQIAGLYASFSDGLDERVRQIRDENGLDSWYQQCIDNALSYSTKTFSRESSFSWIDVGAGKGELAKRMSEAFPNSRGVAIDFHSRPDQLAECKAIEWRQLDLNDQQFTRELNAEPADIVFSITVLEHMANPSTFLQSCISLLGQEGVFYLTVPDFSSFAARFLKKRWPYIIPGEHLNIPSMKGISEALTRIGNKAIDNSPMQVFSKRIVLPYSIHYYLDFLKLHWLKRLFPRNFDLHIPTGILEAGIVLQE